MSTIKGIFEPFEKYVKDQLRIRRAILAGRGKYTDQPDLFYSYTGKTCTIRMASGVDIRRPDTHAGEGNSPLLDSEEEKFGYGNGMAQKYILEGGVKSLEKVHLNYNRGTDEDPDADEWKAQQKLKEAADPNRESNMDGTNKNKGEYYYDPNRINDDGSKGGIVIKKSKLGSAYDNDGEPGEGDSTGALSLDEITIQPATAEKWTIRQGIDTIGGAYGDKNVRANWDGDFGIIPMPGIIDATIRTKSGDGSLREAQVKFICHSRRQLEILETLYMRPGYPLLLEWGWDPYISNTVTIEESYDILSEFFEEWRDLDKLNQKIKKRREDSGGNYDGFIGYCKNFEFKATEEGGYECVTEIIAHGEILESLKARKVIIPESVDSKGRESGVKVEDAMSLTLKAIKANLFKAGDAKYLAIAGTDLENVSMFDSWKNFTSEFLWLGDGSTGTTSANKQGEKGKGKNLENYKSLNTIDDVYVRSFKMVTGVLKKVMKLTEDEIKEGLKSDAISTDRGFEYLLYGTLLKETVETNEGKKEGETGIKKQIYVRWDLLCQLINHLIIDGYKTNHQSLCALTYLNKNERTYEYYGQSRASYNQTKGRIDFPSGSSPKFYLDYASPDKKSVSPDMQQLNDLLGQSFDPNVCLMPHQPIFKNALWRKSSSGRFAQLEADEKAKEEKQQKEFEALQNTDADGDGINSMLDMDDNNPDIGMFVDYTQQGGYIDKPNLASLRVETDENGNKVIKQEIQQVMYGTDTIHYGNRRTVTLDEYNDGEEIWTAEDMPVDEHGYYVSSYNTGNDGYSTDAETQSSIESINADFRDCTSYNGVTFTENSIGMVYFNVDHLIKTYEALAFEEYGVGEEKQQRINEKFGIFDFVTKIWSDVNKACGNYYDFKLHTEHHRPHVARIIDMTVEGNIDRSHIFKFDPQGLGAVSRDFNFSSTISSDIASVISVAAQAPNNSDSLEAVSFKAFHKNIKNRFTDSLLDPAERFEEFSEAMEVAKVELELDLTNFSKMFRQLNQYQVWSNNQYRVTMGKQEAAKSGRRSNINSDSAIALAKDLEKLSQKINAKWPLKDAEGNLNDGKGDPARPYAGTWNKNATNNRNAIIPLEFDIQLDGIAGIVPLQLFQINPNKLPLGYQRPDIAFIVKGETQKITAGQDWVTEINGQLTLLNEDPPQGSNPIDDIDLTNVDLTGKTTKEQLDEFDNNNNEEDDDRDPAPRINPNKIGESNWDQTPLYKKYQMQLKSIQSYDNGIKQKIASGEIVEVGDSKKDPNKFAPNMDSTKLLKGKYYLHKAAAPAFLGWLAKLDDLGINYQITSAIRFGANTGGGSHGAGLAVDFGNLYQLVGGSIDAKPNKEARINQPIYKAIAKEGVNYGWFNPFRLSDNSGKYEEIWHFEYWGDVT